MCEREENPVIVCVDDQREVLAAVIKDLHDLADVYDLIDCESGLEALEVIDDINAGGQDIALIISDHVMPGMSGLEFFDKVKSKPFLCKTRLMLLTGYATHEDVIQARKEQLDMFFSKPWQQADLLEAVKDLLSRR